MLFHLPIKKVYLNRRSRLFQTYQTPNVLDPQDQNQQSSVMGTQQWLCKLGQVLENEQLKIRQVKTIIFYATSQQIYSVRKQLISIIKLMMNSHSASKISNVIYYLCRRSKIFRKSLIQQLNKWCKMLANKQWGWFQQKISFILTDIFIFGIYFTQNEFVEDILTPIFQQKPRNCQKQLQEVIEYRLQYLYHYNDILSLPYILLQKNYRKLLQSSSDTLKIASAQILQQKLNMFKQNLLTIENHYAQKQQTAKTQELQNEEKRLLKSSEDYELKRSDILKTIHMVTHNEQFSRREISNNQFEFESIKKKIQLRYPSVLSYANEQQEQKDQIKDEKNQKQSSDSGSIDSKSEKMANQRQKAQKKLLSDLFNSCNKFKNSAIFHKSDLYCIEMPTKIDSCISSGTIVFIEQLPDQYLKLLQNCCDKENSTLLANQFLYEYNKHCNRVKLVYTIMKQFYERNNIAYIVRVLAIVRLAEYNQINDLVHQQIQIIREKTGGKISRSQYGRYSAVLIQMAKFGIIQSSSYLLGLLQLVTSKHMPAIIRMQFENKLKQLPQSFTFVEPSLLLDLLPVLQKLDREIYYESIQCHIILNNIIISVRNHIKTRTVGYDFQIVNRFNGFVSYIENVKKDQESQEKQILTVQFLKNEKNFREVFRNIQNDIKKKSKKNDIDRIISLFIYSISSQNYIESYIYADLIYQINSKKLDEALKQATISLVLRGLNQGNYQGAANWSRFFGELHRYKVITQNQFIVFLEEIVLHAWFPSCPSPATKIICSALQTCCKYLKSTQKISEINETLSFLLELKCQILKVGGLHNSILEFQVEQILQTIHEGFKYVTSVEECQYIKKQGSKKGDVEIVFNKLLKQRKDQQSKLVSTESNEPSTAEKKNAKPLKYQQKQGERKTLFKEKNLDQVNKIEFMDLQTNSSQQETENKTNGSSNSNKKELIEQGEPKEGRKIKIIGRKRNGQKKIEKIVITA